MENGNIELQMGDSDLVVRYVRMIRLDLMKMGHLLKVGNGWIKIRLDEY